MIKVQGGYITRRYPQAGTYNVQVREIKPQFLDNPLYADSSLNCCYETTASVRVTLRRLQEIWRQLDQWTDQNIQNRA